MSYIDDEQHHESEYGRFERTLYYFGQSRSNKLSLSYVESLLIFIVMSTPLLFRNKRDLRDKSEGAERGKRTAFNEQKELEQSSLPRTPEGLFMLASSVIQELHGSAQESRTPFVGIAEALIAIPLREVLVAEVPAEAVGTSIHDCVSGGGTSSPPLAKWAVQLKQPLVERRGTRHHPGSNLSLRVQRRPQRIALLQWLEDPYP